MKDLEALKALIQAFEMYPGIGPKTASRLAFYTINKFKLQDVAKFQTALGDVITKIKHCEVCGMITQKDTCGICSDSFRKKNKIMVVENAKNVLILEETLQFEGTYHVLNGVISPLDGIGPDDINVDSLEERTKNPVVDEVILATGLTSTGDTTALYLHKILKRNGLKITRIGYGLPAGGDIEYADAITLKRAIEGRKEFE